MLIRGAAYRTAVIPMRGGARKESDGPGSEGTDDVEVSASRPSGRTELWGRRACFPCISAVSLSLGENDKLHYPGKPAW